MSGKIRVGIGGWTFEPWRDNFYPKGWAKARELEYASTHVTAIEINGTFYSTQKPATWADWAKRTPDDFVFSVKASRFCTNRRILCDGAESIDKFINQGLSELGPKLGPILWQFAGTKQFDPEDFGGFLDMLPKSVGGVPLRHAIEPRHESFRDPAFVALARKANAAIVFIAASVTCGERSLSRSNFASGASLAMPASSIWTQPRKSSTRRFGSNWASCSARSSIVSTRLCK